MTIVPKVKEFCHFNIDGAKRDLNFRHFRSLFTLVTKYKFQSHINLLRGEI